MGKQNQNNNQFNRQTNRMLTEALKGVLNANIPEVAGAVGAYYTFKDMPYAADLALYQLLEPAVTNSLVGAVTPLFVNGNALGRFF